MKLTRLVMIGAAMVGSATMTSALRAADPDGLVSLTTLTENINKADNPSSALAAYTDAVARVGENITVKQTFVAKMASLDKPEMVEAQAQELTQRTTGGLPWAVLAYNSAKKDQLDTSMNQISRAIKASPNDNYVLRTAGQLMAWYDSKGEQATQSETVKKSAEAVRKSLESRNVYKKAYAEATEYLQGPREQVAQNGGNVYIVEGAAGGTINKTSQWSDAIGLFYAAPYAMFPNYGYGYQPWSPVYLERVDWWNQGARVPFPFPSVDASYRYLRSPGGIIALWGENGELAYYPNYNNYYGNYANYGGYNSWASFGTWGYPNRGYAGYGGYGGYDGRFANGSSRYGYLGGNTRLNSRMSGGVFGGPMTIDPRYSTFGAPNPIVGGGSGRGGGRGMGGIGGGGIGGGGGGGGRGGGGRGGR